MEKQNVCFICKNSDGSDDKVYDTIENFCENFEKFGDSEKCFYEKVNNACYFFCEIADCDNEVIDKVEEGIAEVFDLIDEDCRLQFLWSHDCNNTFHLIAFDNDLCWENLHDQKRFWATLKNLASLGGYEKLFDANGNFKINMKLYDTGLFRTIYSHERGQNNPLIPFVRWEYEEPYEMTEYFVNYCGTEANYLSTDGLCEIPEEELKDEINLDEDPEEENEYALNLGEIMTSVLTNADNEKRNARQISRDVDVFVKTIPSYITCYEKYGSVYFEKNRFVGCGVGYKGPLQCSLEYGKIHGHKFYVSYQKNEKSRAFSSYKDGDEFMEMLKDIPRNQARFHEIIVGACYGFCDLDFKCDDEKVLKKIIVFLESVITTIIKFLHADIKENMIEFLWSSSSDFAKKKGSLHLVLKVENFYFPNPSAQRKFWEKIDDFITFMGKEKCPYYFNIPCAEEKQITTILDLQVYRKNTSMRTILSKKLDGKNLMPYDIGDGIILVEPGKREVNVGRDLSQYLITKCDIKSYHKIINLEKICGNDDVILPKQNNKIVDVPYDIITPLLKYNLPGFYISGSSKTRCIPIKNDAAEIFCPIANASHSSHDINKSYVGNFYLILFNNSIVFRCNQRSCKGRSWCLKRFEDEYLDKEIRERKKTKDRLDIIKKHLGKDKDDPIVERILKTNHRKFNYVINEYRRRMDKTKFYHDIYSDSVSLYNNGNVLEEKIDYLTDRIWLITNNGAPYFMTKNLIRGETSFERVKTIRCPSISFKVAVGKEKNEEEKGEIIYDVKKMKVGDFLHSYCSGYAMSRCDFIPYTDYAEFLLEDKEHVFNLFEGFAFSPRPSLKIDYSKFAPIMDHIKNIWCRGDEKQANWIFDWFAFNVQRPHLKIKVAFALVSRQGAGKGIIIDWFGKKILREKNYVQLNGARRLVHNFNSMLENAKLILCDEISVNSNEFLPLWDDIKAKITENQMWIEKKGYDSFRINSCWSLIFLTNNEFSIPISQDDRRFSIFRCSDEKCGDFEYFNNLSDVMEDPEACEHFFNYMVRRDISDWKPRPIDTGYRRECQMKTMQKPILFIIEILKGEVFEFSIMNTNNEITINGSEIYRISLANMFEKYKSWATNDMSFRNPGSRINMKRILGTIGLDTKRMRIGSEGTRLGYNLNYCDLLEKIRAHLKDANFLQDTIDKLSNEKDDGFFDV